MDESVLAEKMVEELIADWQVIPTGSGFLVNTAWRWPDRETIEVHVRRVAERDDLFVVTDGGQLFSFLFARGLDLRQDERSMAILDGIAADAGAKLIDFQIVRGADDEDLAHGIRLVLEAVKEGAFVFWYRLSSE